MSKPWMKFYPADWQADPALRSCAITARGLWLEMLCIMQKSEPVGHLLVNGKSPSTRGLATLCGATEREVTRGLAELESAGVFSRLDDGTIFSRRMVRDEKRAAEAKEIGARGGNPALRQGVNPRDKATDNGGDKAQRLEARNQKESNARDARLSDEVIDRIWSEAPSKARERSSKADVRRTLAAALKRGADFEEISRALKAYWQSEDASKADGAYAKGIHRMIEGDRWRDWASDRPASHKPADEPINWAMRMSFWRKDGTWLGAWGPTPREKGCQCPADLLEAG